MDFEETYTKYFQRLFSYIVCRVRNTQTAEDISCKVWVKVYKNLDSYNENKGIPEQWLFTIARNEIVSYFRLYHIKNFFSITGREDITADENYSVENIIESKYNAAKLMEAFNNLNKKEQDIMALKFYSGLNNRQTAAVSGLSESNVGTIINRAVNKLKALIKEEDFQI